MKYATSSVSIAALIHPRLSMWNNVVNAWWQLVFYPATDAPRFNKGAIAMLAVCVATLLVTYLVWYLEQRERHVQTPASEREVDEKSEAT